MAALNFIGALAGLAGSFISARGTVAAGQAQQAALNYEAAQQDIQANEERAAAQAEAMQERRKTALLLSALQARGAASGAFTAGDETVLDLADEIATYGTLKEQLLQYGGASRQDALRAAAQGRRLTGRAAVKGSKYAAAGTILSGISGFAENFGGSFTPSSSGYFG